MVKNKILGHIRLRWVFLSFVAIYMLDFITTVIALCLFDGKFIEANPLQAQFFALGWYGWFMSLFFTFSILFFLTLIIGWGGKHIIKIEKKKKVFGYYNLYLGFVTGVSVGFELFVVVNNLGLLLQLI